MGKVSKSKEQIIDEIKQLRQMIDDFQSQDSYYKKLADQLKAEITERKLVELKLQESEERYRLLYERSPLGYQSLDANGHLIEVNPAWISLLGYEKEEVIGRSFAEFMASGFPEFFKERFPCFKAAGEVCSLPFEMICKDGKHIHVEIDGKIGYNPDGSFKQTHCVLRDITDRKRAEGALRESEERFRTLFELAPDAIYLIDLEGNFVDGNKAAEALAGFSRDELIGKNFAESGLLSIEQLPKALANMKQSIAGQPTGPDEFVLKQKDGSFVTLEIRTFPVTIGDQNLVLGIGRDISERKLAERKLQIKERVIDTSISAISIADPKGIINEVNAAFLQTWGFSNKDEVLGRKISCFFQSEAKAAEIVGILDKAGVWKGEYIAKKKDGSTFIAHSFATVLRDNNGEIVGYQSSVSDITERKQAEEALQESATRYRELFNNMSSGVAVYEPVENGRDFVFKNLNRTGERINRTSKEAVIGKKVTEMFPGVEQFGLLDVFRRVYKTGKPEHHPVTLYKHDRRFAWFENYVYKLPSGEIVAVHNDVTENKQAEEALRDSEERYRQVVSTTTDAVMLFDAETRQFVDVNEACELLYGYSKSEFLKLKHGDITAQPAESDASIGDVLRNGTHEIPWRYHKKKDGTVFPVEISGSNFEIKGRKVLCGVIRDITERKRAEEKLRDSENKSRAWLSHSPVCTKIVDLDFNLQYMSESGVKGLKIDDIAEFYGKPYPFDFYPESFRNTMTKSLEKVKETGEVITQESSVVDIEGNELWYHSTLVPVNDDEGQIDYIMVVSIETTERKQAEEVIRKSERRFWTLVESAPIAFYETDVQGKCLYVNGKWRELTGLTLEDALGAGWQKGIHKEDRSRIFKQWNEHAHQQEPWNTEYRFSTPEGKISWTVGSAAAMCDADGQVTGYIGANIDITDRKRAEKELVIAKNKAEAANVAKSQFLANMSHEIRSPMSMIMGFSELLNTGELNDEQRSHSQLILKASKALLKIIDDILDVSRIEAGKLELNMQQRPLTNLLDSIEPMMEQMAAEKQLQFHVSCSKELPAEIYTDHDRLYQCLVNLISNAVKFTEKGHVHLNVTFDQRQDKDFVRFDVEDTGIGIAADEHDRIFSSFRQVDGSDSQLHGGTGLGLTITKQLAELLNGEITLTSEVGTGSVFSLIIPTGVLSDTEDAIDENKGESELENKTDKFSGKVLVAEDIKGSQILIKTHLNHLGLDVTIVNDGKKAIEEAGEGTYDLILMDIRMPGLDGYEATRRLRKQGVTTPIIALTAYAMVGDKEKCLEAGCDDYLSKPIEHEKLLEILSRFLNVKPG
jgi:hypothetical protein